MKQYLNLIARLMIHQVAPKRLVGRSHCGDCQIAFTQFVIILIHRNNLQG